MVSNPQSINSAWHKLCNLLYIGLRKRERERKGNFPMAEKTESNKPILTQTMENGIRLYSDVGVVGKKVKNGVVTDPGQEFSYTFPDFTKCSHISAVSDYYASSPYSDTEQPFARVMLNLSRMAVIDARNKVAAEFRKELGLDSREQTPAAMLAKKFKATGKALASKKMSASKASALQAAIDALMAQAEEEEDSEESAE